MTTTTTTTPSRTVDDHSSTRQGQWRLKPWMIAAAAAFVVTGGFIGLTKWWKPEAIDAPTVYVVDRRDFPVDLLQKGELKAARSVDVRCEVEGRSTIIWLVPEGTEVNEGDLLVELASDAIDERIRSEEVNVAKFAAAAQTAVKEYEIQIDQNASDIRKAELAVKDAEVELKKYVEGDWIQQETDAKVAVEEAKKQLAQSKDKFDDSEQLLANQYITEQVYEQDKFDLFKAEKTLAKALLAESILHEYTHPQNMRQRESAVSEASKDLERVRKSAAAKADQKKADMEARKAELEMAEERLQKYARQKQATRIVAPAPGLVVYFAENRRWGNGDEIKEGAEVRERQTLISLPDTSLMKVEVRIHEAAATKIQVGLPATVEIEGLADRMFAGKVTSVAALADSKNRWLNPDLKEYTTEITLDATDAALKPGVTARVQIHVEDVSGALAVPVQAVFSKGGHHYVFRKAWGEAEPVPVGVGSASDEYVAITNGLNEGDRILLAISEDLQRKIPDDQPANGRAAMPASAG